VLDDKPVAGQLKYSVQVLIINCSLGIAASILSALVFGIIFGRIEISNMTYMYSFFSYAFATQRRSKNRYTIKNIDFVTIVMWYYIIVIFYYIPFYEISRNNNTIDNAIFQLNLVGMLFVAYESGRYGHMGRTIGK
jgi:hypothetical protein